MRVISLAIVALFTATSAFAQEAEEAAAEPAMEEAAPVEAAPVAAAEPMAVSSSSDKLGLTAGLRLTWAAAADMIDADGEATSLDDFDASASMMVINLNLGYDLAMAAPGLYVGADIPMVQSKVDFGGEQDNFGLGDLSVYAGYLTAINDQLKAGGQLRFKAATGAYKDLDPDQTALGSGSNNIQVNGAVRGSFSGVNVYGDVGYLMTMANGEDDLMNPGDFIYADIAGGYQVNEMIEPRLHILFAQGSDAAYDGTSIDDTGAQWLGVSLDVNIKVDDMISAYVGWGTSMEGQGLNLPYGYVLSGKNTFNSLTAVTAGVQAAL